ncbi:MAG: FG-GAP repeat protein [Alphaproteobacteria bacterium]|nr:FG-GAP repeat protein [Alphaproteobacteria bacterium]
MVFWAVAACHGPDPVDSEAPSPIDSDPPEVSLEPCAPALALSPEDAWVLANGVVALHAAGGTGDYTLSLESGPSGGAVEGLVYQAGTSTGVEDVVLLQDAGCEGEARVHVQVVDGLTVLPARAVVAPGTRITPEIAGGSGTWSCSLATDRSGASVELPCTYEAGDTPGLDRLRVFDERTGQSVDVDITVDPDAALRIWGEGGVFLPEGSAWTPRPVNGSGVLSLSLGSGPFSLSGSAVIAEGVGAGELSVQDRFTGESLSVPLYASAALRPELPRDGERSSEGVVLPLGDIDGDGYDDVLMGFTEISVGAWYEGAVAIWRGGPGGPTAAPDQVIRGGERLRTLGRAVAAADVDEDGHIDLILGADRDDRGETNNGAVLIHRGLGDGSFEESPSRSLYGESSYDRFGAAVAACDFDGDGRLDLAVGAREASDSSVAVPAEDQGAVHVFWGAEGGWSDQADFVIYGALPDGEGGVAEQAGMQLGGALAAGDFDGDGLCDLAAGAPEAEGGDGAALLYRGSATEVLERQPSRWMLGTPGDEGELGRRLAVGDVDGDGLDDLLIAEWQEASFDDEAGAVHLHLGRPASQWGAEPEDPDRTWLGTSRLERLGSDIQLTDWDGDGLDDVVIAAYRGEDDSINQGGIHVYTGLDGGPAWTAWGEEYQGRLGQAAAVFGDGDGDGQPDLLALAGFSDIYGPEAGAPWFVSGAGDQSLLELPGAPSGHQTGEALAWYDLDQDGRAELILGSPEAGVEGIGGNAGAAHVVRAGQAEALELGGFDTWSGSDRLGEALATLDFNGDGYEDLAVGVRSDSRPGSYDSRWRNAGECGGSRSSAGAVLIYLGGAAGLEPEAGFIWHTPYSSGQVQRLAAPGDVDDDGYADLLVGSEAWDEGGGFALLHGRPGADEVICDAQVWTARARYDYLGSSLTGLGDLDGDGCDDFAVGARGEQLHDDWYDQGVVRVFWGWGGASCPSQPEISTLTFRVLRTALGSALAGGQDVDGDGLNDLLVGGATYRVDFAEVGGAWLSPGSWLLERERASVAPGELPADEEWQFLLPDTGARDSVGLIGWEGGSRFGAALALVPDPDRPGETLVAVGLPGGDLGAGARTGGVALYRYGETGLDAVPWMMLVGDSRSADAELGATLLAAEDQGAPLLLVGAPYLDGEDPDVGGAFALELSP